MRRRNDREPEPVGIDDYTGFKVPLSSLKKDWQGYMAVDPDRRNPQDFVRGRADKVRLPFYRPEAPDRFISIPILWENGQILKEENGDLIMTEGVVVTADSL